MPKVKQPTKKVRKLIAEHTPNHGVLIKDSDEKMFLIEDPNVEAVMAKDAHEDLCDLVKMLRKTPVGSFRLIPVDQLVFEVEDIPEFCNENLEDIFLIPQKPGKRHQFYALLIKGNG